MEMIESALKYLRKGYSVIPIGKDKIPLIKWEIYQKKKPTEEEVKQWFDKKNPPNIALVTGKISNLTVIDTDTEEGTKEIQNYLPENIVVPIQSTPHGGKHFFFTFTDGFSNRARIAPGIDLRTEGGCIVVDPSINGNGKGWHWLEGLSLFDVEPVALPDAILGYIKEFAFEFSKGVKTEVTQSHELFTLGSRDEDIFHFANQLAISRTPEWQIRKVLEILAQNCKPPFPKKEIQAKINSALERSKKRDTNISQDLRLWIESQEGHFKVTEYHAESQMVTKEQKHAVIQALKRLQDEGIIEKYGEQRGVYRRIESKADEIDFMGVEERVIDLKFPFSIERWVKILPKNIIIIAGESNAGKTAFLLNVCENNMGKFKINYFSSEMGPMELRARLNKFQGNLSHWKENINFRERMSNFADVIKPNDINIIDFLEITNEFYRVGGMITEIHNKLKKGICLIALQKNPGTDLGLGGMRSIEKARLYMSMGNNQVKIVKGKNWATDFNPNGMVFKFKLIQGSKFVEVSND
jgi:hypothetical protein